MFILRYHFHINTQTGNAKTYKIIIIGMKYESIAETNISFRKAVLELSKLCVDNARTLHKKQKLHIKDTAESNSHRQKL